MKKQGEIIYYTAVQELNSLKRLPAIQDYIAGFIDHIFRSSRVRKPQDTSTLIPIEYLNAIVDAIYFVFYGSADVEPEFKTDKEYENHKKIMDLIFNRLVWNCKDNYYIAIKN